MAGEVLLAHEDDECELDVTPSGVPEELFNGFLERLWTFPKLALGNEEVTSLPANEDGPSCR
jgi:hypothetical protein